MAKGKSARNHRRRGARALVASTIAAVTLLGAGNAQATTVTMGSNLAGNLPQTPFGSPIATFGQATLPGATVAAPFNGTIVSWKVIHAGGGPLTLRVVHLVSGGNFIATGSTASGPITSTGILSFPASLPIKAGDLIGIQPTAATDTLGISSSTPGGLYNIWQPPLATSGPGSPASNTQPRELGFNATVEADCVVPSLKRKSLKTAKKLLQTAGCEKGNVKRPKGKAARKRATFVKKQTPAPGTVLPGGSTEVDLKLGPKKK